MMAKAPLSVPVKRIFAGKLRRYHAISWWRQALDVPVMLKNIRDIFLVGIGFLQSLLYLRKIKPDVVFTKGGYVCLPVGLAAHVLGIPLVIHDSDAHPGLTNRILARYATAIGTGAPVEHYPYPKDRTKYVGIPVNKEFRPLSPAAQQKCKDALGLTDTKKPLVVVAGGGLGARSLNHAIVSIVPQLLPQTAVMHITGQANFQETTAQAPEHIDYIIKPFLPEGLALAYGAADVVVTRAGATSLGELAGMAKPIIIVPSPYLAAGHQLKNADIYAAAGAAVVLDEKKLILNPIKLKNTIVALLKDAKKRQVMAKALAGFARPDAAIDMAALVVTAAYKGRQRKHEHKGR